MLIERISRFLCAETYTVRLLFWTNAYLPHIGGLEIFTARLAEKLLGRGHAPAVICDAHEKLSPEFSVVNGVAVWRLPFGAAVSVKTPPIQKLRFMKQLTDRVAEIKRDLRPDLIHINFSDSSPLFHLRTRQAWPAPVVIKLGSALLQPVTAEGVAADLLHTAAAWVAQSDFAANNLSQYGGIPREAVHVIYPGVPVSEFSESDCSLKMRSPRIIFLGRLSKDKGADLVISALARMKRPAELVIIGEGPERTALATLAHGLGVKNRVVFAGAVSDSERSALLATGTMLMAPSVHQELFGMIAVEGALSGLPVIASNVGGLKEIVVDQETGLLVPPGDPDAIARASDRLLGNLDEAERLGAAGRRRAHALFTLEQTVDAFERLYLDVIDACAARTTAPISP